MADPDPDHEASLRTAPQHYGPQKTDLVQEKRDIKVYATKRVNLPTTTGTFPNVSEDALPTELTDRKRKVPENDSEFVNTDSEDSSGTPDDNPSLGHLLSESPFSRPTREKIIGSRKRARNAGSSSGLCRAIKLLPSEECSIIREDRAHYKPHERPPFVQDYDNRVGSFHRKAFLVDHDAEIILQGYEWDNKHFYWVTVCGDEQVVLSSLPGGNGGGCHFRLWRGHSNGYGKEIFAQNCPSKKASNQNPARQARRNKKDEGNGLRDIPESILDRKRVSAISGGSELAPENKRKKRRAAAPRDVPERSSGTLNQSLQLAIRPASVGPVGGSNNHGSTAPAPRNLFDSTVIQGSVAVPRNEVANIMNQSRINGSENASTARVQSNADSLLVSKS